ncbi:MAG: sigma-70 family RNA polymerase sigma factor [Polyangiaceae bacterium]|jgi:RNA polymerase sigma-70 factor (ECF subfamily)|nr:sigma-70 family RNA polymerase sigma factor [Polyangiaceae bacterium]MBK8939594.1 sigma-70 family RNA polymerase sigma factor [Polyangiaceae bacterium]
MAFFFFRKPESVKEEGARSGATDPFAIEMLTHLDTLYGVASRMTRGSSEAEDLVQDTLVKAMRARDQFEAGTNLKAWLLRILTNTFINRYRRGGMERDLLDGPAIDPVADGWVGASTMRSIRDPESQALKPLVEAELTRALDELPPDFRLAVILSDVEELSYKEIAEVMGCPIGTVMSRLHRGRKLLQGRLRDHAIAMGIVTETEEAKPEPESVRPPTDINTFRTRRRAAV